MNSQLFSFIECGHRMSKHIDVVTDGIKLLVFCILIYLFSDVYVFLMYNSNHWMWWNWLITGLRYIRILMTAKIIEFQYTPIIIVTNHKTHTLKKNKMIDYFKGLLTNDTSFWYVHVWYMFGIKWVKPSPRLKCNSERFQLNRLILKYISAFVLSQYADQQCFFSKAC